MRVLALALVIAVALAPVPSLEAAAPKDVCIPACTVVGAMNAFTPSRVVLTSGSTVTWTSPSLEQLHTATGTDGIRGCLHLVFNPGGSKSATFVVLDGLYTASGGELVRCASATQEQPGLFRLAYVCLYHPPMVGELYVAA